MASGPERFDVEKVRNEVSKSNSELFLWGKKLKVTKINSPKLLCFIVFPEVMTFE